MSALLDLVDELDATLRKYRAASQPQPPLRLELIESRDEHGSRGYTVIAHHLGTFADRLCKDEALGVLAAALFGPAGAKRLPYQHTYAEWVRQQRRWRHKDEPYPEPIALIGCNTTHLGA